MSPELEQAIKERIALGHNKEQIVAELREAEYDDATIEQVYATLTVPAVRLPSGALIGYGALIKGSFKMIASEWRLLLVSSLYGLLLLALAGGLLWGIVATLETTAAVLAGIFVGALTLIGFLALTFGFQRGLLMRAAGVPYLDHVTWALPNVIGILLVSLYVQFATTLGSVLLIIPGIALSIYLFCALLVRIADTDTGVMALVRSTQLVYGRWWGTLGRLLFATLTFLLCTVPFVLFGVFVVVSGGASIAELTAGLASYGVGAASNALFGAMGLLVILGLCILAAIIFVSFLVQCSTVLLYESLRATAVPFAPEQEKKLYFWMKVAVIVGIPVTILFNAADIYMEMMDPAVEFESALIDPTAFEQMQNEEQAEIEAELETFMQEFQADFKAN